MRLPSSFAAAAFLAAILLICTPAYSDTTLTSQGTGIIDGPNTQKAEDSAKQDAYTKVLTQYALKLVPHDMAYAVLKKLPDLIAERGMQDAIVIRFVSKSKQGNTVYVTYEFRIKDDFLKQWISSNRFDIPTEMRPRILLAVTTSAQGETSREWWTSTGKKKYSGFETKLSSELELWGENVFTEPPETRAMGIDPLTIASIFKADLLISGSIRINAVGNGMNQCVLKLNLVDVAGKTTIASWNITKKAELSPKDMYGLILSAIIDDMRTRLDQKITNVSVPTFESTICIENFRNYQSYQKVYDSLASTEGIMDLQTSKISDRSICHLAKFKGTLNELMQNFKDKNISGIDIQVNDDSARIIFE